MIRRESGVSERQYSRNLLCSGEGVSGGEWESSEKRYHKRTGFLSTHNQ